MVGKLESNAKLNSKVKVEVEVEVGVELGKKLTGKENSISCKIYTAALSTNKSFQKCMI